MGGRGVTWHSFSGDGLTVDVRYGDPISIVVAGVVDQNTIGVLRNVLESAMGWPGSPDIELNLRSAQIAEESLLPEVRTFEERAHHQGRQFTIQ